MAEERGLRPGETGDAAGAVEPGTVSRLLLEIAQASEEETAQSWREALRPGDTVGRYQIRREIGRGGFGAVYEAFDPELGRTVALKALKPGRTRRLFSEEWIRKEAEAVAKLDHPAIVTIFDVGTCPAGAYLVMELLQGETLAERIAKGPLPVDQALRVAEQMAEGLSHAHQRGVLHRDLKPANVFLCADGRVKLLDFGLAHLLGTDGSSGAGTPAYMAPEQAAGAAVDERADVYAAAMVLGEMLTGKRPVERATPRGPSPEPPSSKTELMWEARKVSGREGASEVAPSLDGVPRPVARVVKAALAANPEERPKDGGKWLAELRSARMRVDRPRRIRRVTAFATAFVVLGLGVAGIATWRVWERQIPGGRPTVAVADFANETGDGDLDSISGLLITALEQGTQLRVLTRGRMLDVLKQLGKGNVTRIDEALAREVGKETRASALLLATIRKLGTNYVVEMRAIDPLHDEYVFTVSDKASSKEGISDVVDRLGETTRRKLGVATPSSPPRRVASITTTSPRAWELLSRSFEHERRGEWDKAREAVQAALAEDPGFSLAHFHLARQLIDADDGEVENAEPARLHLEEAERRSERLPDREREELRAMRDWVDGRWNEARRVRIAIAEAHPLDKQALYYAGDVLFHLGDLEGASTYLDRSLALDPTNAPAVQHFTMAAIESGHADRHLATLRRLAASNDHPGLQRRIANALIVAGQEQEGLALHARAQATKPSPLWPDYFYQQYLGFHGRAGEAESLLRQVLARHEAEWAEKRPGVLGLAFTLLGNTLTFQGRLEEARAAYERSHPLRRKVMHIPAWLETSTRMQLAAEALRKEEAIAEAAQILADPDAADPGVAWVAILTAPQADLRAAARLAADARAGLGAKWDESRAPGRGVLAAKVGYREPLDAIADFGSGDEEGAIRRLRALTTHPDVSMRSTAHDMLALIAADRGDCASVILHLDEVLGERWSLVNGYSPAPVLHRLAVCHEKLGDLAKARERNAEMLKLWAGADSDLPLLIEAKAMQARLAVK